MSVFLASVRPKPVALVCPGGAMNTNMSAFMELSPKNDLKNGLIRA